MIGRTVLMELRTGWKGLLIISILVFIVGSGMAAIYPTFKDTLTGELEGADKIDVIIPENEKDDLVISWEPQENADIYIVLEDNKTSFFPDIELIDSLNLTFALNLSGLRYVGGENETVIPYNKSETQYFTIFAANISTESVFILGIDSTGEVASPFDELLENPGYAGFTGGRDIDFASVRGFLALELFSWIWILTGMFMAYFSVSSVTGDFEKKRMDLIFSTPISREQYVIEKFAALSLISLIMVLMTALGLIAGIEGIGETDSLPHSTSFLSLFSMQTFLMIIAAFGIFLGMTFRGGKAGMGINIAFVFSSFIFVTIAGFSDSLSGLKYISIMHYWDYNSMLLDDVFNTGYFLGLLVASLVILVLAIYIFKKRDIPT
jgi:ABC-type transport system involved in multi-copper enzyme maturation permease subunit